MALICIDTWLLPLKGRLDDSPIPKGTNFIFIDMADSKLSGKNQWNRRIVQSIAVAVTAVIPAVL